MKPILFGVLAFVLSLGGTTLVLVKRAPHPAEAAAVTAPAADSTPAAKPLETPPKDSTIHAPVDSAKAGKDSTAGRDSTASPPVLPSAQGSRPEHAVAKPAGVSRPAPDPAAKAAAIKQVARVLSAMKAAEAAKVLAFLSDTEVEGILRAVGPRQAADFMTNLPKERAADLSRRLMAPRASESSR